MRYSGQIRKQLADIIRAGEWWEFKLAPIFGVVYATALVLHLPIISLWRVALTILLALVPGATYVSVINDLTDRADDLAAGKRNRLSRRPPAVAAMLVIVPVAAGVTFSILWRRDVPLLSFYLAAWLAFSLYSLPPFRWKSRGILGVIADASGAHLFPTLVAVVLTFRAAGRSLDAGWLAAVAVWSFAYGVRGILWHQLSDDDNDRIAAVATFVRLHSRRAAARLGTWGAFPAELAALALLLWRMHSVIPLLMLALYIMLAVRTIRRARMNVTIVDPRSNSLFVLREYYDAFQPAGILLASAMANPQDLFALAAHALLFPSRTIQTLNDIRAVFRNR